MADFKQIGGVHIVTDTETNQEKIGDVQGGFDDQQLIDHIRAYGPDQLTKALAYMSWQVWDAHRHINQEKQKSEWMATAGS